MDRKKIVGLATIPAAVAIALILASAGGPLSGAALHNEAYTVTVFDSKYYGEVDPSCFQNVTCLKSLQPLSERYVYNYGKRKPSERDIERIVDETIGKAMRSTLKKPPYPIVNKSIFQETLVTFEMPKGSRYRYLSLVVNKSAIYVYQFNDRRDYRLYAVVDKPTRTVETEITYEDGNYTHVTKFSVAIYEVSLSSDIGVTSLPPAYYYGMSIAYYTSVGVGTVTRAAGWFYINPGVAVVGVAPDGASYAYYPFTLCTTNAPGAVSGVGTYVAYTYVYAGYATLSCPVTAGKADWPWVGVDANGRPLYPTSDPYTIFTTSACACNGITFQFPPIGK